MKNLKAISSIVLLCVTAHMQSQQIVKAPEQTVPVYDFRQFEPILHPTASDTLYVVNFWATWCAPCIKELPYFEQLGAQYTPQKVKVLLISLDFKNQIETRVIPFMERKQLKSKVIVLSDPDANAWIDKVDPSWSGALPATMIIKGDKREFHEKSFTTYDELESLITKYL